MISSNKVNRVVVLELTIDVLVVVAFVDRAPEMVVEVFEVETFAKVASEALDAKIVGHKLAESKNVIAVVAVVMPNLLG